MNKEERLEIAKSFAYQKGGGCHDESYIGNKTPMSFTCVYGHKFKKSYNKIFSAKLWCPYCPKIGSNGEVRKHGVSEVTGRPSKILDKAISFITSKNARVLDGLNTDTKTFTKLKITCENSHQFQLSPYEIANKRKWCELCFPKFMSIENVKLIAKRKGGVCLSDTRGAYREKSLLMRCENSHLWKTSVYALTHSDSWCHVCAKESSFLSDEERQFGLNRLLSVVKDFEGTLVHCNYESVNSKCKLLCSNGHEFEKSVTNVVNGLTWCPECAGKIGETFSIEFIRETTGQTFKKVRPKWLIGIKGKSLELDAYCEDAKLAIEYQGQQHYKFIPAWHKTIEYFEECQARDALKRKLCAEHGVVLFEIPYIDKPTKDKMKLHIEALAQKACLPYKFNPEYVEFLSGDVLAVNESAIDPPLMAPKE